MSEVFGVTPWVDGAVSTGPLSELEQDRLDVAARKGSLVAAMDNPITGGNDFSGDVSTLRLPAGVTDLTDGVGGSATSSEAESAMSRYGAVLNGTTDDSGAIQQTLDYMASTFPGRGFVLPFGAAKINSGLTVDVGKSAVDFGGMTLKPAGAITALTITAGDDALDMHNMRFVRRFAIDGDLTAGQVGIYTHRATNATGYGPSRIRIEHASVLHCDIGEKVGSNSYGQTHIDVAYAENNIGIWSPNGQSNSYELPKWIGCWIHNNILGLDVDEGQLTFDVCNIDYNRKQADISAGRVLLMGCHVETNLRRATYSAGQVAWSLSGSASLIGFGGRIICTPGDASGEYLQYIFDCATQPNYEGGVFWQRPTIERLTPVSGYIAKGNGNCRIVGAVSNASADLPKGVHESQNMLDWGTFEAAIFPTDNVFVSSGGGNSSRIASTNVTVSQGAAGARSGSNGLIITKNVAAGGSGTADICIFADLDNTDAMHCGRLYFKSPASTAAVTIQFGYFAAMPKVAGSDIYLSPTDTDVMTVSPTMPATLSSAWQEVTVPKPYRRPKPGMRYVGFRLRVNALALGDVMYVDDVEIHGF